MGRWMELRDSVVLRSVMTCFSSMPTGDIGGPIDNRAQDGILPRNHEGNDFLM